MSEWRGALGSAYDEALWTRLHGGPDLDVEPGHSGFFSQPSSGLDPNLFDRSDRMRPAVRKLILEPLLRYMGEHFNVPAEWLKVWVAGSGVSYQWNADRSMGPTPGDLDVLLAIDHVEMRERNPRFQGFSDATIDELVTQGLKHDLWPSTAHTAIGTGHYEVTYYVNPGHEDIREINPYAAYNLILNRWDVRPIALGQNWNPEASLPTEWWSTITLEQQAARKIVDQYNSAKVDLDKARPGSPQWLNELHRLRALVDQGAEYFDRIHGDRRNAFSPGGQGYLDYYNVRWQSYKRAGLTPVLHEMKTLQVEAQQAAETSQYGAPLKSAAEALREAGGIRG